MEHGNYRSCVMVDAANGVGAPKLRQMLAYLQDNLQIDVCNDGSTGKLNYKVNILALPNIRFKIIMMCAAQWINLFEIFFFFIELLVTSSCLKHLLCVHAVSTHSSESTPLKGKLRKMAY